MAFSPGAVGGNRISKASTHFVYLHEHEVVDALAEAFEYAVCMPIVELIRVNLLEHIAAYSRVVRVAHDLAPEEYFYKRVRESDSNCVHENVTWSH